ncbi:hypothetical protein CU311_08965 [Prochlorococcus marinus str. MU1402]|uniref:hypothetical protein n=1 Tax=Prochlorococcus marinus TaxID=1219 RepID=UPI001AD982CA|nr:hypothetical protein [Prochlorococcus marinus]MBO8232825.1 hypothetical protein [Prochlorococcus marinus XMU1402]MBW3057534.1 hypothetical protein [Prochlorococcus marinus str. MU1402]
MSDARTKLLIIELNEFCPSYLKKLALKYDLYYLKKFLDFRHTHSISHDEKEFEGLDPWVQWVSIHSGLTSDEHGIERLGESKQKKQLWNYLSEKSNLSWGVIGPLNASRGSSNGCVTFCPDPWNYLEKPYPDELNDLLALPIYVSKNYLAFNFLSLIKKFFKSFLFFFKKENFFIFKVLISEISKSILRPGINIHTLTTLFDYVLVLYYSKIKSIKNIDISILFLNHIAHLQHHFWEDFPKVHPQMEYGVKICNKIFEILIKDINLKQNKLLILNGFKQKKTSKNDIQIYRQINPRILLKKLGISEVKIEQNMTNDAILEFQSFIKTKSALDLLSNCSLNTGEKLFYVSRMSKNKLFFRLNIYHHVEHDAFIKNEKMKIPFYKYFKNLNRTGSHINQGDIFSPNIKFPKEIKNHKIFNYLISIYDEK